MFLIMRIENGKTPLTKQLVEREAFVGPLAAVLCLRQLPIEDPLLHDAPVPQEGLTPPLHPRKGHSPLDPFLAPPLLQNPLSDAIINGDANLSLHRLSIPKGVPL